MLEVAPVPNHGCHRVQQRGQIERKGILLIGRHVGIDFVPERNEAAMRKERGVCQDGC